MNEPEASPTDEKSKGITPQERTERRANRIRIGNIVAEILRLGWEMFTHKW